MRKDPVLAGARGTAGWAARIAGVGVGGPLSLSEASDHPPARGHSGGSAWVALRGSHSRARGTPSLPRSPRVLLRWLRRSPSVEAGRLVLFEGRQSEGPEAPNTAVELLSKLKSPNICLDGSAGMGLLSSGAPPPRVSFNAFSTMWTPAERPSRTDPTNAESSGYAAVRAGSRRARSSWGQEPPPPAPFNRAPSVKRRTAHARPAQA